MQAIRGANLKENISFSLFGSADFNLSSNDKLATTPEKRNESGFETNISLYKTENSKLYFMGNAKQIDLGKEFLIGENQVRVKKRLLETEAGFGYATKNDDRTGYSFSAAFGSASDKFLSAQRDSTVEVTASYSLTPTEKGQFILLLHYSNNRTFLNNVPIPAFVYVHRYSKGFIITAGLPFIALSWFEIPTYALTIVATPGSYGIDGSKNILPFLQFISGFNFKTKSYMHSARLNNKDRLKLEDKKFTIGLKALFSRNTSLSLTSGFSFDRFISEGESMFKTKGHKIRQANDSFIQSRLSLSF